MNRISRKHLESKVATINHLLGAPEYPYYVPQPGAPDNDGRGPRANIGNYHIGENAPGDRYGTRYCLQRMINEGGGVSVVSGTEVCGAQAFADVLSAMISGIQAAQEATKRSLAA
jgi:hypothetical protein